MHTGMRANRLAAAHRIIRLMLLGSPPDMVHGALSHRARLTACLYTRTTTHKCHLLLLHPAIVLYTISPHITSTFLFYFPGGSAPSHIALSYCVKNSWFRPVPRDTTLFLTCLGTVSPAISLLVIAYETTHSARYLGTQLCFLLAWGQCPLPHRS